MDYEKQRAYVNENNPFMHLCGITVTQVQADFAAVQLTVTPELFNPGNTLHGGAIYTLADAAATTAARTDGYRYTTVEGSLHYHRAVTQGLVRATAIMRHRGRTISTASVEITDAHGKLLADGTFTIFRLEPFDLPAFRPTEE